MNSPLREPFIHSFIHLPRQHSFTKLRCGTETATARLEATGARLCHESVVARERCRGTCGTMPRHQVTLPEGATARCRCRILRLLLLQQQACVRQTRQNQSSVGASFRVAGLIASSGKPFTGGEFIKKCWNAVAEEVCPEKREVLNAVSLSASTITRPIEEMGSNLYSQLQQKTKELDFFSPLALDESADLQDTAQLLIFIRGVRVNFERCEDLAALQSLKGTPSVMLEILSGLSRAGYFGIAVMFMTSAEKNVVKELFEFLRQSDLDGSSVAALQKKYGV